MNLNKRSNAETIKYYVKSLLNSEPRSFSRQEIEIYLRENDPKGTLYSTGTISGALRTLTFNSNEYVNIERGRYQHIVTQEGEEAERADLPLRQKAESILIQTKQNLKNACTMNALYMTEDDRITVDCIRKVIAYLDEEISNIRKSM